jgi:hypothetical protein
MRGLRALRSWKRGYRFDFCYARSLPPGPTIPSRVTGSFRNLHGGATKCQGGSARYTQSRVLAIGSPRRSLMPMKGWFESIPRGRLRLSSELVNLAQKLVSVSGIQVS